jgi:hypothetical protein
MSDVQLPITTLGGMPPEEDTEKKAGRRQIATAQWCDVCGAAVDLTIVDPMRPEVDLWLCEECLRTLSAEAVERLASALALRGVPWS